MNPILYESRETDFNHNGLGKMNETLSAIVTEVANGEFELEVVYPIGGRMYEYIQDHMLIKAKPNSVDDPHVFRIYEHTIDTVGQTVTIHAHTKSNDLGQNLVKDVVISSLTPQEAMNSMKMNLVEPTDYSFVSDITTRSSTEWKNRNPLNCIAGEEGSLIHYWGGEIKRDNRTVYLYRRRGRDNVAIIRDGKNIEGLSLEYSTKGMVTKIIPYRTYTPENSDDEVIEYGTPVESNYIGNYPLVYVRAIDYSNDDDVSSLQTMNTKASRYFTENNGVDKPSVNVSMSLVELSDSNEYEKFKDFENVELFDTVTVYSKQYDIHIETKITTVEYDSLAGKNISLEMGSYRTGLIESTERTYMELLGEKEAKLTQTIQIAANGKNRIFRGVTEPVTGMVENDIWYQPVGAGETMMYVFDGAYWQLNKVSAGLLGGTLDAENGDVNLINLNASSIVTGTLSGLRFTNDFIRGGHVGQLVIEGDIRMQAGPAGFSMDEEVVSFYDANNRTTLSHDGLAFYRDNTEIAAIKLNYFSTTDSSAVTFTNAREGEVGVRITQNRLEATERQEGQANSDIFVVPSGDGKLSVTDKDSVLWWGIKTKDIELQKGAKFTETLNGWLDIYTPGELTLRQGGGPYALSANAARVRIQRDLDMGGFSITNQSDIRLKTNIVDSDLNALAEIERLRFIEYEWDKSISINKEKPSGRTFGIVAQYSPFLQTKVGDSESYLSVDISKQVNLNSKAIQELLVRVKTLEGLE